MLVLSIIELVLLVFYVAYLVNEYA